MPDERTRTLELLLQFYVEEINISRRIGWKHGDPPPIVMNVVRFFNEAVGDFPQHRCERWFDKHLRCPFGLFEAAGMVIRTGDPPDDLPNEPRRAPRPVPRLVLPAQRRAMALAEAEAVVAAQADKVPVGNRSLGELLRARGPAIVGGAATGVAAGLAIKGFAGGGFHFPQVFDPRRSVLVR